MVTAPVYSHLTYDIVPGAQVTVRRPDILVVEGLNVLQPARVRSDGRQGVAVSDFFDFSIYVDARVDDVRAWYVDRFLRLRADGVRPARVVLPPLRRPVRRAGPRARPMRIWHDINERNLRENVLPTRGPGEPRAHQGPGPLRAAGPAPQGLSRPRAPGLRLR